MQPTDDRRSDPARRSAATPEQRLESLVARLPGPPVTRKRALVGQGHAVGDRLFAFIGTAGRLIAKVPAGTVADLIAAGEGEPVTMGSRTMREWVGIPADRPDEVWQDVVAAAHRFVAGQG